MHGQNHFTLISVIQTYQLTLYREVSSVCSDIYGKHTDALYGKNVERSHEHSSAVHKEATGY